MQKSSKNQTLSDIRVTVLMPVYNGAHYLGKAIESVLAQTHRNFELLLINDGSTDESLNIMTRYAQLDNRIGIMSHENCGMGESLNHALRRASTEWVVRMDADDIMFFNRLERQISFIVENPNIRVTCCRAQYIDEKECIIGKTASDLTNWEAFHRYLETGEAIGLLHPGVAMHRQTVLDVGGYRGQYWPADDIDLWNRLAERNHAILVQDEILMYYRVHPGSAITCNYRFGRLQYEWVRACMRARRLGQPEPSRKTFLEEWNNVTWYERLNRARKINAKYLYRKAGHNWLAGSWFQTVIRLGGAALLQPVYTIGRLKSQLLE